MEKKFKLIKNQIQKKNPSISSSFSSIEMSRRQKSPKSYQSKFSNIFQDQISEKNISKLNLSFLNKELKMCSNMINENFRENLENNIKLDKIKNYQKSAKRKSEKINDNKNFFEDQNFTKSIIFENDNKIKNKLNFENKENFGNKERKNFFEERKKFKRKKIEEKQNENFFILDGLNSSTEKEKEIKNKNLVKKKRKKKKAKEKIQLKKNENFFNRENNLENEDEILKNLKFDKNKYIARIYKNNGNQRITRIRYPRFYHRLGEKLIKKKNFYILIKKK